MFVFTTDAAAQLVLDKVSDKYVYAHASLGEGVDLVFRNDRIEIEDINKTDQSYQAILLYGANRQGFSAGKVIDSRTEPIPNKAMAAVLKSATMDIVEVTNLMYKDVYDGVDLKVEQQKNGILLHFSATDAERLSRVKLAGAFGESLVKSGAKVSLVTSTRTIDLIPQGKGVTLEEEGGQWRVRKGAESHFSLLVSLR